MTSSSGGRYLALGDTSALAVCLGGGRRGVEVRPWGGRGERREGSNYFLSELLSLPASFPLALSWNCLVFLTATTENIGLRSKQQGLSPGLDVVWLSCSPARLSV